MHNPHASSTTYDARAEAPEEILSDPISRRVLEYIRHRNRPVDVDKLARHIVAEITEQSYENVPSNAARRVQTWLHHGQLPLLEQLDLLEYDVQEGMVRPMSG